MWLFTLVLLWAALPARLPPLLPLSWVWVLQSSGSLIRPEPLISPNERHSFSNRGVHKQKSATACLRAHDRDESTTREAGENKRDLSGLAV